MTAPGLFDVEPVPAPPVKRPQPNPRATYLTYVGHDRCHDCTRAADTAVKADLPVRPLRVAAQRRVLGPLVELLCGEHAEAAKAHDHKETPR